MRLFAKHALTAALVAATSATLPSAQAQSPSNLTGTSMACRILSGTGPFPNTGYFVFAASNTDSGYRVFGITGVANSTGTYSYSKTGDVTGLLRVFNDTAVGNATGTMTHSTPSQGDLVLMQGSWGPDSQLSSYSYSSTAVPTTLDGRTFFCTVADGAVPLMSQGSYRIDFSSATNYTTTVLSGTGTDSSGTCVYTRPSLCLGRATLTDSVAGGCDLFYGFTSANAGWMAVSNVFGGFQIASFTTVNRPFSVSASKGTSTATINLTWVPQPGASSYQVFRTPAGSVTPAELITTTSATTFADRTCLPGQQYVYTIASVSSGGVSQLSPATTASTGWRNIAPPTSLAATDGTLTAGVQLTWPTVTYATSYNVYRSQPMYPYELIGNSAAPTFLDITAIVGIKYTYKVLSVTVGESLTGVTDTGWRNAVAPTGLLATDGTSTACVSVTWQPSASAGASGYPVSGYKVYRGTSVANLSQVGFARTNVFNDQSAVPGRVYTYAVRAATLSGDSTLSNTDTGFRATGGGGGGVIPGGGGQSAFALPRVTDSRDDVARANLVTPIQPLDPARQWPCDSATREAWAAAIEAGSRDLDGNGEPDLCQHARGDLDLSGTPDASDVALLLTVFGDTDPVLGDMNGDGRVDGADLRELLRLVQRAR